MIFNFEPFKHTNIYQIVFCAIFWAKQAKFELLYAQKRQKRLKT